ncbi:MAG: hypothetical protein ACOYOQ_15775 [Microthrixaceae bacterium]
MGLFRKSGGKGGRGGGARDLNCIYLGEPFPVRGERFDMSGVSECDVIMDRSEIPATWTGLAELVRTYTGEPRERAVLMNILGSCMAMMESSLSKLGQGFDLSSHVDQVVAGMRRGDDQIGNVSYIFAVDDRGPTYFEFEVVKTASLLASQMSREARERQRWPYPDIWAGDATLFPYPY